MAAEKRAGFPEEGHGSAGTRRASGGLGGPLEAPHSAVRTLRVFRWSPGEAEGFGVYRVDAGVETTVLDALVEIQRAQDPTLAFRYACRVGMCGSCAMVVDGRERWACRTRLSGLPGGDVTVRPLYHFPLLRDLVVDMTPFNAKLRSVDATFRPAPAAEPYALISRDSKERREIDPAIECIGCGM